MTQQSQYSPMEFEQAVSQELGNWPRDLAIYLRGVIGTPGASEILSAEWEANSTPRDAAEVLVEEYTAHWAHI